MSNDVAARIAYGDLEVQLIAEGASWNPDVAHDLIARIGVLWKESLQSLKESGVMDELYIADEDDE